MDMMNKELESCQGTATHTQTECGDAQTQRKPHGASEAALTDDRFGGASQLRKAVASPGGLQNMSEAELHAVLVKMGYPHSLQALLGGSNAPLPSLQQALANRQSLAAALKSGVSFPLMVGPGDAAMDALRKRMGELKAVMESPMMQSVQV